MENIPLGNIIFSASTGGLTLVGMNQDDPFTPAALTLIPSREGKPGMVIFGGENGFESGMNENGLVLCLSPFPRVEVEYAADKNSLNGSPWLAILDSCSTVTDVLNMLDACNPYGLEDCQAFISDQSGDAAILGIGENKQLNVNKKGAWYLILSALNRFQSSAGKCADYRYEVAEKMLTEKAAVSFPCFRDILSITHSEGQRATIYSIIYDLTGQDVYLYYFHDFSKGAKFNLGKALKMEGDRRTFFVKDIIPIRHTYYAQASREVAMPAAVKKLPIKTARLTRRKTRLSTINGIGETYEKRLKEIGIDSVENLLLHGATPKGRLEISERSSISDGLILSWVNRADLCRIKGVGNQYSDLLELAGVDTVPELAQRNTDNLYLRLVQVNDEKNVVQVLPSQSQVEEWISQAKDMPRIVFY